ncbi:MAG: hypothetical protein J5585_06915 [Clostridia bacterium]|nr:hypothetical protein [Clostridia bacterium]
MNNEQMLMILAIIMWAMTLPLLILTVIKKVNVNKRKKASKKKLEFLNDSTYQELISNYRLYKDYLYEIEEGSLFAIEEKRVFSKLSDAVMLTKLKDFYSNNKAKYNSDTELVRSFAGEYKAKYNGEIGERMADFVFDYVAVLDVLQRQCTFAENEEEKELETSEQDDYDKRSSWLDKLLNPQCELYNREEYIKVVKKLSDSYDRYKLAESHMKDISALTSNRKKREMPKSHNVD